ncbi:MAG: DMT family transporter [Planktomarina sp.]
MAWIYLFIAGFLEPVWAGLLKAASNNVTMLNITLAVISAAASLTMLTLALRGLPLAIAYPVFTGMGSVGAVAVTYYSGQTVISMQLVIGVALIVVGITLLATVKG